MSPDPQESSLPTASPFFMDLDVSDFRLVPPHPTVRLARSQTAVTATTSTRHVPTLVQTDNNDQNNNDNNTFATAPRGKRSRNLADELSSPVLPRQTQKKVSYETVPLKMALGHLLNQKKIGFSENFQKT